MTPTFESNHPRIAGIENLFGHVIALIVGFVMMVLGLALVLTMVMLPVGLIVGFVGAAVFVGGLFAHVDERA